MTNTGTRRLLILGASGFLGPHLVRAGLERGWSVHAAARRPQAAAGLAGGRPVVLEPWDALAGRGLEDLVERVGPTDVVLAAALSRVDECERDPALAARMNTELAARAARESRRRGLRLVHLSTDLVFGQRPPRGARYDEEDPPSPMHVYGRTKAAGEAAARAEDPGALVVRLPLLYGDSGGRGLGATDQVLAALERGERPLLFTDEWRTPLDAANAARAVLELCAGNTAGLLHLAGPRRLTRHGLGLALLAARGWGAERARAALRAAVRADLGLDAVRPSDVALDAARARELLGTPLLAPEEALGSELP